MSQLGSGQGYTVRSYRMDHDLVAFVGCNRNELQVHDWTVLRKAARHKDSIYQNITDRAAHAPGKAVARASLRGCWCYDWGAYYDCTQLLNSSSCTIRCLVFSVYVMLLKEWKLNKQLGHVAPSGIPPHHSLVTFLLGGRILNPYMEMRLKTLKEAWHWKEGWGHRNSGF